MGYFDYDKTLMSYFQNLRMEILSSPLNLGGVSSSGGGVGGPPGGFVGYLPQRRVTYDTSEIASLSTPISGMSLLDNINHIRYDLEQVALSGTGISVQEQAVLKSTNATVLNFSGPTVTAVTPLSNITFSSISFPLNTLSDVVINSPVSGEVLGYNGTNWINTAVNSGDMTKAEYDIDNDSVADEMNGLYGTVLYRQILSDNVTSSATVSGISPVYDYIEVYLKGRSNQNSSGTGVTMTFNGDTTSSNYYGQSYQSVGSSTSAAGSNSRGIGFVGGATSLARAPGSIYARIINPFSTTFFKEVLSITTYKSGATKTSLVTHALGFSWHNTAAINHIVVGLSTTTFSAGTFILILGCRNH